MTDVATYPRERPPLVGRQRELQAILGTMSSATPRVVLVGAAGVGKSRLASEVVAHIRSQGHSVACCYGTVATATVPFGALAPVLPADLPRVTDTGDSIRRVVELLRSRARERRFALVVDDVHLLDDASIALLDQAARHQVCAMLLTTRSRTCPRSFVDLWKDGQLARVDVGNLARDEMTRLLTTLLGGPLDEATVRRLRSLSAGNLFYLRELLVVGRGVGSLTARDGVWSWRGPVPMLGGLVEAVEASLGRLDSVQRQALELVAYAQTIGLDVLSLLVAPAVLDDLETRGLVTIELTGRRTEVHLAHPLVGELLRATCPTTRGRRHQNHLADAVVSAGARRQGDLLRVATWRLDSRCTVSVQLLTAATRQAWSARHIDSAERLGRIALARGGGPRVGAILGSALLFGGTPSQAESVLAKLMAGTKDANTLARLGCARAFNMFVGLARVDEASDLLDRVGGPTISTPLNSALNYLGLAVAAHHQHTDVVLSRWNSLGHHDRRVRPILGGDVAQALALLYAGRYADAIAALDHNQVCVLPGRRLLPWLDEAAQWVRCWSLLFAGAPAEADEIAARLQAEALDEPGKAFFRTVWCGVRSHCARMRGQAHDALRWAREAVMSLQPEPTLFDAPAWAELARAAAAAGHLEQAKIALRRADAAVRPAWRMTGFWVDLARPWVMARENRNGEAATCALAVADDARECGAYGYQAAALHDAVRLGEPAAAAPRLRGLADRLGDPLTRAFAAHAAAAGNADPDALEAVAGQFASLGMTLLAAEALAQAVSVHYRAERTRLAHAVSRRLALLTTRFDGAPTPALAHDLHENLTPRQFEVARLAATGLTSQAIAGKLGTSRRTIDNHLHAVYAALGVTGRTGLTELLTTYATVHV